MSETDTSSFRTLGTSSVLVGASLKRKEDARLVAGRGRYLDDMTLPGLLHLGLVRSPHAHARVVAVDGGGGAAARRRRGGVDAPRSARAGGARSRRSYPSRVDAVYRHPVLAGDRVRHAGEARRGGRGRGSLSAWPTRSSASASVRAAARGGHARGAGRAVGAARPRGVAGQSRGGERVRDRAGGRGLRRGGRRSWRRASPIRVSRGCRSSRAACWPPRTRRAC